MAWVLLILAACCEMAWPIAYKYTNGFRQNLPLTIGTMLILGLSFLLMMKATDGNRIHVGTAYAVWTGLGAAGTAALGILLFHEPRDWQRLACLGLIILGVAGLKFFSPPESGKKAETAEAVLPAERP